MNICLTCKKDHRMKREADDFAIELLLPRKEISMRIRAGESAATIAEKYLVSEQAMRIRIRQIQNTRGPCD